MIEIPLPLAPALFAPVPAPDPASLLKQWVTLQQETAALRTQNAALQERICVLDARPG